MKNNKTLAIIVLVLTVINVINLVLFFSYEKSIECEDTYIPVGELPITFTEFGDNVINSFNK